MKNSTTHSARNLACHGSLANRVFQRRRTHTACKQAVAHGYFQHLQKHLLAVAFLLSAIVPASAAAPVLNHLFPAGARQGTTLTVTASGKLTDHPLFVSCSRDDVRVELSREANKLDVTVSKNAKPGICWIRLYNTEGASALRPFVIGLHSEVQEIEPNNRLKKAHVIEHETIVVNGVLAASADVDTYAVKVKAGQTLIASMTANHSDRIVPSWVTTALSDRRGA